MAEKLVLTEEEAQGAADWLLGLAESGEQKIYGHFVEDGNPHEEFESWELRDLMHILQREVPGAMALICAKAETFIKIREEEE